MNGYILLDSTCGGGYYKGKKYIYQGCKYPCYSNKKDEAKIYKSKKVVENVCISLADKCGVHFHIIELKEGDNKC